MYVQLLLLLLLLLLLPLPLCKYVLLVRLPRLQLLQRLITTATLQVCSAGSVWFMHGTSLVLLLGGL